MPGRPPCNCPSQTVTEPASPMTRRSSLCVAVGAIVDASPRCRKRFRATVSGCARIILPGGGVIAAGPGISLVTNATRHEGDDG